MSDDIERAHETIHEASHAHAAGNRWALVVGVLVSALAAALALTELGSKSSQNAYLTDHIALSNNWSFYQSKHERAVTRESEANLLESLPNASDPAVRAKIAAAREYAARMRDDPKGGEGMKQLADAAKQLEAERTASFHAYHGYEYAVGALQIAIVLASVSLVTRSRALTIAAGVVGGAAALYGLVVGMHLF